ncbi:MAG TPA: CsbD family protein [Xanthobacteraceae bacterium]|nr:CsbD family protein [Xanthobacteraceae bacterium]
MDENRVVGTARNIGGKAQESVGRTLGDTKTQVEGMVDQVKGTAQNLYGQARDSASQIAGVASDTVAAARNSASTFESTLRNTIETQPYTSTLIALGIGWLLGRIHRPM